MRSRVRNHEVRVNQLEDWNAIFVATGRVPGRTRVMLQVVLATIVIAWLTGAVSAGDMPYSHSSSGGDRARSSSPAEDRSGCRGCHRGIEDAHPKKALPCATCHLGDAKAYDAAARKLAHLFSDNFKTYEAGADADVRAAGPLM